MNTASLELCKELYELSAWDDTQFNYNTGNGKVMHEPAQMHVDDYPAYDLGYLLRKLPSTNSVRFYLYLSAFIENDQWEIGYTDGYGSYLSETHACTPEDAAAKLAIELFEQGILQ